MTSKAELKAQELFHKFNEHRMLIGFTAMAILTVCSIYFNFRLGSLNSNPSDYTRVVMPLSYSFLDIAALVFAMCLFSNLIKSFLLKLISWVWFGYLVALSLFACLSCIIALDAQNASSGDEFKRQQLNIALAQANRDVETWQSNVANADKFKTKHQITLQGVIQERNKLIDEISKLDSSTPAAQVVFESGLAFMPAWMDEDQFRLFARLAFGVAMILTPLLLTGLLAHVLGDGRKEAQEVPQNLGKSQDLDESFNPWSEQTVQEMVQNRTQKPVLSVVQSQIPEIRTKTVLKKPKGCTHKSRTKLKEAILGGEPIKYDDLKTKFGVGKSTISSVLNELQDSGQVEKVGRSWELRA